MLNRLYGQALFGREKNGVKSQLGRRGFIGNGQFNRASGLAFVLGLSGAAGAALLLAPQDMAQAFALPPLLTLALGGVLALVLAGYFVQRKLMPGPLTLFRWSIALPDVRWSAVLLVLGVADIFVSAAALWVLLPDSSSLSFIAFGGIFAIVVVAGLLAHVPGAVGVLDFQLQAEAVLKRTVATAGFLPADVTGPPAIPEGCGQGIGARLQQRGDIVGAIVDALKVVGPLGREKVFGHPLAADLQVQQAARGGRPTPRRCCARVQGWPETPPPKLPPTRV